jgi:HD-GYP domain-containing protein (c-di-GMP phosphodiesterase class II)
VAQLQETRRLLETAIQAREQSLRQNQTLTEDLQRAKSLAEGATPAHQMTRLLRSVEPIAFSLSVETVTKNFAELALRLVNAQAIQVFLWDERGERFSLGHSTASSGLAKGIPLSFKKGEGLAGFAADRMELVHVEDVTREDRFSKSIDEVPGILTRTVLAGPLVANGRLVGVIEAINRKDGQSLTGEDGVGLAGLALLGAAALEKALIHRDLAESSRAVLGAVADLIETRGGPAEGRADRVRRWVLLLGEALGVNPKELREVEWAALLYNVGKVTLPVDLLAKHGELLPKDRELLLGVPRVSSDIFRPVPTLAGTMRIVRHVNERWDGQGVPDRLAGEDIPIGSRLIAVVDAYDGLTSGLHGRRALPAEVALKELEICAGKPFDPACVETLLRLGRAGKLQAAPRS